MAESLFSSVLSDYATQAKTSIGNALSASADQNSLLGKALNFVDPSNTRLAAANLLKGGAKNVATDKNKPNVGFAATDSDWRLKISLAQSADYFYNSTNAGILAPLKTTGGVIFPYTPTVSVNHTARYSSQQLTHSNYTNYAYEGSEVQAISITGDFTVQNLTEGQYLLACIYFFRSATKMFFGQGGKVGNPPPMVFLNGYGSHYFPNVPCVVTSFQHTMPADVDYLPVPTNGGQVLAQKDGTNPNTMQFTRVPTSSQLVVTLQPIYTRRNLYDKFNLDDFAAGKLIKGNGGYI